MAKKKTKKWIKWIAVAVAVVIVAGGGIVVFRVMASSKSSASTTTFAQTVARNGNIEVTVSGSGTVSDASEYSLTSSNAGTIDSLPVKQGDKVTKGETIAHINDPASAQTVSQQQNSLQSAENNLAQSEANLSNLYIKAPIAGRVKSIVPSVGDDLSQIKALGNLAVISTKRAMTVTVNPPASSGSQQLTSGESVTVVDNAKGQSVTGTVTSTGGQGDMVTIGRDDWGVGDSATVKSGATTLGSGSLALVASVPIQSSGSGTISNVYVSENQMVSKGQNLFKLNGTSVENDIAAKQAAVTAAQNQLTAAQTAESKDTITSPVDGVIAEFDIKDGDSLSNGAAIATIIDPNSMQTVVSVDELDIAKVQLGQKANVALDAITGKTFTGEVAQIDPIGTSTNGVTDYNVTVTIDNPTGVMVGMTTNADIITQSKDNTVIVSASAILEKNGNTGYVILASKVIDANGKSIQIDNSNTRTLIQKYGTQVSIGLSNTDQDEITSGVNEGDRLAIPVTINKVALASLSNSQSSTNAFGLLGGAGGGFGGGAGGGYTRRNGGTGNTVSGSTSTTSGSSRTTGSYGGGNG